MYNQLIENKIAELTQKIDEAHNCVETLNSLSKYKNADRKLAQVLGIKNILGNVHDVLDDLERLLMEEQVKED
jgi:hypothetical protein